MPKYEIHEVRKVVYTIEVPDGVTKGDVQAARLDSESLQARGCGGVISDYSELKEYTVHRCDDDEPADVVLDERLREKSDAARLNLVAVPSSRFRS